MISFHGQNLVAIIHWRSAGNRTENTWDTLYMLWNSWGLSEVNMLFFWSVVGLNVFGLMVAQVLGSVFRAVLLTTRTASVR